MTYGLAGVLTKMQKPILSEYYNDTETMDVLEEKLEKSIVSEKKGYLCSEETVPLISFILGIAYSIYNIETLGFLTFLVPQGFLVCSLFFLPIVRPLKLFYDSRTSKHTPETERIKEKISKLKSYEAAMANWENFNTETGLGYWLSLKGEALEVAVASMLRRHNWQVETTKRSGDGGIDLILKKNENQILVQCKGHAQKIGVGPIRDAAGVKSVTGSKFILIGPSGFTSGAVNFAEQSEVLLWDARQLTEIAKSGYIS